MSAFLVVDTKIKNQEAYEEYKTLAKPIAEKFGVHIGPGEVIWTSERQRSGRLRGLLSLSFQT